MRLAVKFSPPVSYRGGSQRVFASNLLGALLAVEPATRLYTASPSLFSDVSGLSSERTAKPIGPWTSLKELAAWLHEQATFESRLAHQGMDVLYCPYHYEALACARRMPQVVTVHDLIPLIWPNDFKVTSILWRCLYIPAIRNAAAIIADSENTRRDIVRYCGVPAEKVYVVPVGYAALSDQPATTACVPAPFILYVSSSQYPHKNLLRLINAYKSISAEFPHKLCIVGKAVPRFSPQVRAKIAELGLGNSLIMLENLTDAELGGLYRHADLFVYPSLYEGFGIPPLEAMACGVPVVASRAASIPEVCGEAAYYFDPYSVDEMSQAIRLGLTDAGLRERLRQAGRDRARLFSWERMAQGVVDVCRDVVGSWGRVV